MKQLIAITLTLGLLSGLSCRDIIENDCEDEPSGNSFRFFSVSEYTLSQSEITDSTGPHGIVTASLPAPYQTEYNRLVLVSTAKVWYHASAPVEHFGMAAYACSPPPFSAAPTRDSVISIVISSDSTFESGKAPGTSLNEYFDVFWESNGQGQTIQSLNDFSAKFPEPAGQLFRFVLRKKPVPAQLNFKVTIQLKNGKSWTGSTPLLTLN